MRKSVETEQERTRRLDQLVRSLVAENRMDAERSAELQEAAAPFAAESLTAEVRELLDARFASEPTVAKSTASDRLGAAALVRA